MKPSVCILIPVYNDWDNLALTLGKFSQIPDFRNLPFEFIIVNDGSLANAPDYLRFPAQTTLLNLNSNMGHQKAIAIGLAFIHSSRPQSSVLTMDADGQDRPEDAIQLYRAYVENPGEIIAAERIKRPEDAFFRLYYFLFKVLFHLFSGNRLSFGNFTLVPAAMLNKIVYRNELWSHFPATLLKSGLPLKLLPVQRAHRQQGRSKMGLARLILHGMEAFLVFLDKVSVKLIFLSVVMIVFPVIIGLSILFIKIFTSLAIPGWTSTLLASMLVLFMQSFLLAFFTLFLYLISQTQKRFIPAIHYHEYILNTESIPYGAA